ncbi:hypothetical protein [Acanthopleuribacter pedis]|uniref:Uncharacterized protein n=1 Tax=Acanthopleuribacter pedis TaxID=442870 RepID=A0A8J7QC42_9BACT|nr:hypothetical protein [Acanthopleuribacter pedis]MBO1321717.1 hypothetical protein [Acanthopleuribacter pedis]
MHQVFECDETQLMQVDPAWSAADLLNQNAVFYLKDLTEHLDFETNRVKKKFNALLASGSDPWQEIGIRKIWSHWMVRMKIFRDYYTHELRNTVTPVNPDWTANELLQQPGVFSLAEVCKKIPFSAHQLRYQSKRMVHPREEIGVYKDEQEKAYLVDMPVFAAWMNTIWADAL